MLSFLGYSAMALSLQEAFSSLKDPRVDRHKRHMLIDIIILTICAVISGADGWEAIEQFGKNKEDWLKKWIDLENGIHYLRMIALRVSLLEYRPQKCLNVLSLG